MNYWAKEWHKQALCILINNSPIRRETKSLMCGLHQTLKHVLFMTDTVQTQYIPPVSPLAYVRTWTEAPSLVIPENLSFFFILCLGAVWTVQSKHEIDLCSEEKTTRHPD